MHELVLQTTGEAGDATPAAGDALAVEVALVWLEQCQALIGELLPLLELVTGAAARPLAARLEQLYHSLQVWEYMYDHSAKSNNACSFALQTRVQQTGEWVGALAAFMNKCVAALAWVDARQQDALVAPLRDRPLLDDPHSVRTHYEARNASHPLVYYL